MLTDPQAAWERRTMDSDDDLGELTDTDIYEGELEAGVDDDLPTEPVDDNIEDLAAFELRVGETGNADVAAEEGLTWVPPIDPPVIPTERSPEGVEIAAGFGVSALDEPYDVDHHSELLPADDEFVDSIREALRADSATSTMADSIRVIVRGGTVILRGEVDDLVDTDEVAAVVARVQGVEDVVDELGVRALDDHPGIG